MGIFRCDDELILIFDDFCSIFHGQNQAGHDFGEVYTAAKWREKVEEPLLAFATSIFREWLLDVQ